MKGGVFHPCWNNQQKCFFLWWFVIRLIALAQLHVLAFTFVLNLTCLPSAFFSLTTFNWAHSNWLFTIDEELCFVSFNPVTIFPLSGEDGQFAQVVSTVHPLNIPKDYGFVQRLLIFIHTINTLPKFVRGGPQFSTVLIHPIQNWWAHHVITGNMARHYDIVTQGCDKNSRLMDYD